MKIRIYNNGEVTTIPTMEGSFTFRPDFTSVILEGETVTPELIRIIESNDMLNYEILEGTLSELKVEAHELPEKSGTEKTETKNKNKKYVNDKINAKWQQQQT